jgi:hypothetical protein
MADPISMAASIAPVIVTCYRAAKGLHSLQQRYQNASITIMSMRSESVTIGAALGQLELYLQQNASPLKTRLQAQPQLMEQFNTSLTGCQDLFSRIDQDIGKVLGKPSLEVTAQNPGWRAKAKLFWKEDDLKKLLEAIRGQQVALLFLLFVIRMLGNITIVSFDSKYDLTDYQKGKWGPPTVV